MHIGADGSEVYEGLSSSRSTPDLWTEKYKYIDVKSPEKSINCCRNANKASKQGACVCLTDHQMKDLSERIISGRNESIWKSKDYHHDVIFWLVKGKLIKYERPAKYKRP